MRDQTGVTPSSIGTRAIEAGGGVVVRLDEAPSQSSLLSTSPDHRVKKVIVAVHGVGDQYSFATLQSVVNQFGGFYHQPPAIPLGQFHTGHGPLSISPPYPKDLFDHLAFSEVYWAKIPRAVVDDGHTLEESKKWAGTIVERLRMRWRASESRGRCREMDFDTIKLVLAEMIQTLAILERLSFVANRAGLFTFNLRKLLDDYLGDVQIVAEFGTARAEILKAFDLIMSEIQATYPTAEIFIVSHSEGTVVSFLGILRAGCLESAPAWLEQIRGFMTIGSPIDKHLILWPELFPEGPPRWTPVDGARRIEWRNYYDRGDPIGFSLDEARAWLENSRWDRLFSFTEDDDFGFDRYPFPGKAHVDYWTDPVVFGHFIETVVKEPSALRKTRADAASPKPPGDVKWKKYLSYIVPYLGVAALLFLGVFIVYKAVIAAVDPKGLRSLGAVVILRSVLATTILLLGITAASRILRLANDFFWHCVAFVVWAALVGGYVLIRHSGETVIVVRGSGQAVVTTELLLAMGLGLVACTLNYLRPSWGLKPLVFLGTAFVALVVGDHLYHAKTVADSGAIWPVFLATAAFLYLWWLSALVFDLVFVWHLHIRHARAFQRIREIVGATKGHIPGKSRMTQAVARKRTGRGTSSGK